MLPLCKPYSDSLKLNSYRPIINLPCIEKIIEEYMIICSTDFFETNNIIHINHHGSRKDHSPTTALTEIHSNIYDNLVKKNNSMLLATDLSAAFDTIDHGILLKKLDYYGIRGKSLKLMESFLIDRKTYVNIDTFSSNMIEQGLSLIHI